MKSASIPRFLRLPAVLELTGFSKSQLRDHVSRGTFPAPVKLSAGGRAIAWDEDELVRWRNERLAARDRNAA